MKQFVLYLLIALGASLPLCAQSSVNVTAMSCLMEADGVTPIANGTLTVHTNNGQGHATGFSTGSALATVGALTRAITAGSLVGSLSLANPATTSPPNIGYDYDIFDSATQTHTTYTNVAISPDNSGNWNLCALSAGSYTKASQQGITVAIGSVSPLAPGATPYVYNVGTVTNPVLDFGIPQGPVGVTGAPGPQGNTGATGATGAAGAAATVAVGTVTTGAAGTSASVNNTGTSSAAVLSFTIPQGATGPAGATGATGPAGPAPSCTGIVYDTSGTASCLTTGTVPFAMLTSSNGSQYGQIAQGSSTASMTVSRNAGATDTVAAMTVQQNSGNTSGDVLDLMVGSNKSAFFDGTNGGLHVSVLYHPTNSNNAFITFATGGTTITHNQPDAGTALTAYNQNAAATGDIFDVKNSTGVVAKFTPQGALQETPSGSQPACSSTTEGTFWYAKGSGSTNGSLQVCQDQSGTFSWVTH